MYNFIKIFFLFIKNNKKKFQYLLVSICIYLVIENIESFSDLIKSYQKINYDYIIWYILSISTSSILVCYYVFLNFKNFNIKINFLKWSSMYFNSQIVDLIPSAGLVYRAIFLKKLKLDYLKFATIYIFIIWISLLVTLSIHFIYVCIFLDELKMLNINIYFYFFSLNLFLFTGYYAGSYFSKTKTFKHFFSSNNILVFLKKIIDTMVMTFDHVITNKKYIKLIIILILIYASEMTTMFFCLKFLGFNISFNLFLIFFITVNLSTLIGIFPKNIAIAELLVGSVFKKYSLNFSDGVFVNLVNRFFYLFIYLIFAFTFFMISKMKLKILKR